MKDLVLNIGLAISVFVTISYLVVTKCVWDRKPRPH